MPQNIKMTLVFAIVFSSIVVAQSKLKFGLKTGFNISSIARDAAGDTEIDLDTRSKFLYFIGGVVEVPITERLSFQPEVIYSKQGTTIEVPSENTFRRIESVISQKLDYLNIPLLAKFNLADVLYLEAGPQVGVLLKAEQDDLDNKDAFKSVDFGANLGVSIKFQSGINFGFRYNFGLSNINEDETEGTNRNRVFQGHFGYFF
jgi:hypothetical protein